MIPYRFFSALFVEKMSETRAAIGLLLTFCFMVELKNVSK
jgi:hypothetical protein